MSYYKSAKFLQCFEGHPLLDVVLKQRAALEHHKGLFQTMERRALLAERRERDAAREIQSLKQAVLFLKSKG